MDDAKQLKSVEPSGYNPVLEIGGIDTKLVPRKVAAWKKDDGDRSKQDYPTHILGSGDSWAADALGGSEGS